MPLVLHVVDRLTGGVPLAVRDYITNGPSDFSHVIMSPWEDSAPAAVWHGLAAEHQRLSGNIFVQIRELRRVVTRLRPAVVHAHSSFPGAVSRAAGLRDVDIVYSPHCFKFDDPATSRPLRVAYRAIERSLASRTTRFAALSAHEAELARELGSRAAIVRVPNAPSVATVTRAGQVQSLSFGMVGRVARQKAPHFMAQLADVLRSSPLSAQPVWIGGGDSSLEADLMASGVRVTGWLTKQDVTDQIDSLGLYVHTAAYEGFPLSVLDAAARGVPVIARRIPALDEIGIHVFDTPEEGAALVMRALSEPAFRVELLKRGARMLAVMSAETQASSLDAAWRGSSRDSSVDARESGSAL